jgi:ribonuclease-3
VTATLDLLQYRLGYTFSNQSLFVQALTHRSYSGLHNERLEFLGDAILDLLVSEYLYQHYPSAAEGELSHMRAQVVCGERLAEIGLQLQLGSFLYLGAGEDKSGGRQRQSSIANAVEAIIAAVYLDGGMEKCRHVVHHLFAVLLEQVEQGVGKDAKTRLQEYLQARHMLLPQYCLVNRTGNDHDACFTMECIVEPLALRADATASSRKKAEQMAAEKILEQLEQLHGR